MPKDGEVRGEEGPRRRRTWLPWTLPMAGFLVVGAMLLAYVAHHARIACVQYEINDLRQESKELRARQGQLQLDVQELTSLERIERLASGRLGMIPPTERQVLDLPGLEAGRRQVARLP